MIITCPTCQTRFQVADVAFADGAARRLRCASCGHLWQFAPAPPVESVVAVEPAAPALELRAEPRIGPAITELPEPALEFRAEPRTTHVIAESRLDPLVSEEPSPALGPALERPSLATEPAMARRYWAVVGGAAVTAFVAATILLAVFARERIMAVWPATTGVYAMLDLVAAPGAGLEVTLTPTRTADALVIDGSIVNGAGVARPIPRLRLTLRDGNKTDLVSQVIDPPVPQLSPGARAHFNAVFAHPSVAATKVDATFAAD